MREIVITDELRALGQAQAAAGAAFRANPTPINRAAYAHAIRRALRHAWGHDPKAIRFLDAVYRDVLGVLPEAPPRPDQEEDVA
ncbi:MAG TPA: hypothetical protein VD860_16855 [Azospirillum sp.]|nr:hypothetical protein [Azospirillum sp.]